jgi:hypothetical protein
MRSTASGTASERSERTVTSGGNPAAALCRASQPVGQGGVRVNVKFRGRPGSVSTHRHWFCGLVVWDEGRGDGGGFWPVVT